MTAVARARRAATCLRLALLLAALVAVPAEAQRGGRGRPRFEEPGENPPYDGRWTFVRIRYEMGLAAGAGGSRGGFDIPWSHDYPRGERNFAQIVGELTTVRTRPMQHAVLRLDDPQLFRYPIAYMAEPGYWSPSESEVLGLSTYLRKGGFIIFDDFRDQAWLNLERQMRRVLPELRFIRIDGTHPIFDAFYRVPDPEALQSYGRAQPTFWAIFEDNDPRKRLLALANRDNDLSEFWEFTGQGFFPVDLTNEAYKLGINYLVYALSR